MSQLKQKSSIYLCFYAIPFPFNQGVRSSNLRWVTKTTRREPCFLLGPGREIRILRKQKPCEEQGLRREFANSGSEASRLWCGHQITRREPCFLLFSV